MSKSNRTCVLLPLILVLLPALLLAGEPPDNTIPIIGMLLNEWQLTPELLCEMSWKYFDGIECNYYSTQGDDLDALAEWLEPCGFLVVLAPLDLDKLEAMGSDSCRGHYSTLGSQNAFIEVNETGSAITGTYSASSTETFIGDICEDVVDAFEDHDDLIWFYRFFDEPAATQRGRQYNLSYAYDNYFPSYLTADTTCFRADSAGVYSWVKHALEQQEPSPITSTVFAGGTRIYSWNKWAFYFHPNADVPNAHGRAEIIRGFCNMRYQPASGAVQDNFNDLVMIDAYPFRHVGSAYQDSMDYTPALGDSLNIWMLDHMEEAMDSTFLAARGEDAEVLFWPQTIGICGGPRMWEEIEGEWVFMYDSYLYRFPSPAEMQMLVNLALLRQARGLMPFCLATYYGAVEENLTRITTGLLDPQMIPFDAPFEEWAYTGRPQDSLYFVRPDYIPPFMGGFDPLYTGPGMPPGTPGQRARQNFLEWKFAPYGRLWNALPDIFDDVAVVAPELTDLYWLEGYEDAVSIACVDDTLTWMTPEIKVFAEDEAEVHVFYVNRNCRDASDIFSVSADDLGWVPVIALDHSRRFFIPGEDMDNEYFLYYDTLEAGGARLVEFFAGIPSSSDPDLRITQPDIHLMPYGASIGSESCTFTRGDSISILAGVYNLGMGDASDIVVTLFDVTSSPGAEIDRDTLDFNGLSASGYVTDADTASFLWIPNAGSAGLHRLRVSAATAPGEDETDDNAVSFPVLIEPVDFATVEQHDPWDMEEAVSNPPDWYTNDIVDVDLNWDEHAWTDSVSGVFEGVLAVPDSTETLFQGEILLMGANETLDADTYSMVSMAGVCNNPNSGNPSNGCGFFLVWQDDHDQEHVFNLAGAFSNPGLGDGWDQWKVFEPFDLYGVTGWEDNIHDLRLRFQTGIVSRPPQPIAIRLGWFRITE